VFEDCSDRFVDIVSSNLVPVIYSPEEIVYLCGEPAEK